MREGRKKDKEERQKQGADATEQAEEKPKKKKEQKSEESKEQAAPTEQQQEKKKEKRPPKSDASSQEKKEQKPKSGGPPRPQNRDPNRPKVPGVGRGTARMPLGPIRNSGLEPASLDDMLNAITSYYTPNVFQQQFADPKILIRILSFLPLRSIIALTFVDRFFHSFIKREDQYLRPLYIYSLLYLDSGGIYVAEILDSPTSCQIPRASSTRTKFPSKDNNLYVNPSRLLFTFTRRVLMRTFVLFSHWAWIVS